jgi:hypothetical protein
MLEKLNKPGRIIEEPKPNQQPSQ